MKNLSKNLIYLFIILITLSACTSLKDGLVGTKRSSSDEFLVEKKNPLTLPPEFNKLPVPNTIIVNDKIIKSDEENDLRKILGTGTASIKKKPKTLITNSSLEKSIIEKIKNN